MSDSATKFVDNSRKEFGTEILNSKGFLEGVQITREQLALGDITILGRIGMSASVFLGDDKTFFAKLERELHDVAEDLSRSAISTRNIILRERTNV